MKNKGIGKFCLVFLSLFLTLISFGLNAQTDSIEQEYGEEFVEKIPFLSVNGYLKELGTLTFTPAFKNFRYDNLIHNRLNSIWNFSDKLVLKADLRTRIFNGSTVRSFEAYGAFLEQDNAWADMSWTPLDTKNTVIHSTIDRLFLTYSREKWELSIGRQRINWGQTYVWNPNDLFNTYSYLDFDYEERPGTDAVRFQYFTGYASGIEVAIAPHNSWDESVAAFLWRFNRWNYDFQILGGNIRQDWALGFAWAGSIRGWGFKGEMTYFRPRVNTMGRAGFVNATVGLDYVFPNSLQVQGEFLYNGNWRGNLNPAILLVEPLPATNLFPAREVIFLGANYQLHPLISVGFSSILAPGEKFYIFVPSMTFSLAENLDLLFTAQMLRNQALEQISPNSNLLFARLKWSF